DPVAPLHTDMLVLRGIVGERPHGYPLPVGRPVHSHEGQKTSGWTFSSCGCRAPSLGRPCHRVKHSTSGARGPTPSISVSATHTSRRVASSPMRGTVPCRRLRGGTPTEHPAAAQPASLATP